MVLAANMCLRGEDFASFSIVPTVDGLRALAAASDPLVQRTPDFTASELRASFLSSRSKKCIFESKGEVAREREVAWGN
jgi:hypothetical protein